MTAVRSWLPLLLLLAHCGGSSSSAASPPTDNEEAGAAGSAGQAGGAGHTGGAGQAGGAGGAAAGQGGGGMAPVPQGGGSKKGNPFDFNADGFADVVIGSPGTREVYVYFGSAEGLPGSPAATLTGKEGGLFGTSLAQAGDVNGDGFADLVVGDGELSEAYIYLGNAQGLSGSPLTLQGKPGSTFGKVVASAGDTNHDGFDDTFIDQGGTITTHLYLGGPQAPMQGVPHGPAWNIEGWSVAGAGDVNGDGFDDLVVGTEGTHEVSLYLGSSVGLPGAPTTVKISQGGLFGVPVAGAGDVNGDGFDDVLVGDIATDQAHVFLGTKNGLPAQPSVTLQGPATIFFGGAVSSAGDVNGDGFADILVGAQGANRVYLYLGSPLGMAAEPTATLQGPDQSAFGQWVATARDLNGDGFDDVVIGAPGSNQAFVYLGSQEGLATAPATILTGPASGLFGYVVALATDPAAPAAPRG